MTKGKFIVGLLFSGVLLFFACKHEILFPVNGGNNGGNNGGGTPGTTGRECSPDSVYFSNDIQPILSSNCTMSGCHDATTHAEGINLTTYAGVMKEVKAGNGANSSLYKVIIKTNNDRMPPPPMSAMPADQVAKIKKWIDQGAQNNSCDKCDTTNYTYSSAIKILVDNKCKGCHNPASLGGGIDLSTYNALKAAADNGSLYGSVTWETGFSAMPKGSVKMPDCEIKQIRKWIDNGSPNN